MRSHNHRVIEEHNLTPAQWAILFSASYYLPAPPEQFICIAQLESEENFSEDELTNAFDECLSHGWIRQIDPERVDLLTLEINTETIGELEHGIVLTNEGCEIKEQISHALMETVEID